MHYKMTPEEFFKKLIELYRSAREPKYYNPNIFRGRSFSISSELEDLTALFIALNNPKLCNYFTDQPIKFEGTTTKYPDIVIQNDDSNTIDNLIDTKTDTGWNRDGMLDFCMKWEAIIEKAKGKETSFSNGKTRKKHTGVFSENLHYHVIVATEINSGQKILEDYKKVKSECKNVSLYILSSGVHPNNYELSESEILDKMTINKPEFDRLMDHLINGNINKVGY